jgi:hypothetical protein
MEFSFSFFFQNQGRIITRMILSELCSLYSSLVGRRVTRALDESVEACNSGMCFQVSYIGNIRV